MTEEAVDRLARAITASNRASSAGWVVFHCVVGVLLVGGIISVGHVARDYHEATIKVYQLDHETRARLGEQAARVQVLEQIIEDQAKFNDTILDGLEQIKQWTQSKTSTTR